MLEAIQDGNPANECRARCNGTRHVHADMRGGRQWSECWLLILLIGLTTGCGRDDSRRPETAPTSRDSTKAPELSADQRAYVLLQQGQPREALKVAQGALVSSPNDPSLLKAVASAHAALQQFDQAADTAALLATLEVNDPAAEALQAFDWHLRAGDLQSAEQDLRNALQRQPEDPRLHRTLAQLLSSQGRRYEAREHVISLIKNGAATPRELLSIVELSSPFELVSFEGVVPPQANKTQSPSLFALGRARRQYIAEGDPNAAWATIQQLKRSYPDNPAVAAFEGRLIAETDVAESFTDWLENRPEGTDNQPEFWLAVGTWLRSEDRLKEATRAFAEALRRDPTDRRSLRLLAATMEELGESEKAASVRRSLASLDDIFGTATHADPAQAMKIAQQLQQQFRLWESVGWYQYALQMQGRSPESALAQRREQIAQWQAANDVSSREATRLRTLVGFDVNKYPLPDLKRTQSSAPPRSATAESGTLLFNDIAAQLNVDMTLQSGFPLPADAFYLYQANGAGLAAFDYDLDGQCDLYLAQAGGDPQQSNDSAPNQLFRQINTDATLDVSQTSGTGDRGFAQGICVGDVNQDGWPDLLVANIGRNVLYVNQGDGTFQPREDPAFSQATHWTSSLGLGDLDGDHLPEVVEVNYLDDPLIFQRMCRGKDLACTPQRFRAAEDRILKSLPDGRFETWSGAKQITELPNYGFGLVIANFDDQHGNDVFISNDGDVNHFWQSGPADPKDAASEPRHSAFQLQETANLAGCGIGASGLAQACMGIAAGDLDRNHRLDLLVTNFHNEPANLFLQRGAGFFVDEARSFGLAAATRKPLGFGTQAVDFDNDGWLDAAILNGHIYDARYADIPFQMQPQLLKGGSNGFTEAAQGGDYWQREQLGRTLVSLDWDRDGRLDLLANHLDHPVALLHNQAESGRWLQLEVVGTTSERDAIGCRVRVNAGGESWTAWQTGGDGYMGSNEALIAFGLKATKSVDELHVFFPSGQKQTFRDVDTNRRYLIVEGEPKLFPR